MNQRLNRALVFLHRWLGIGLVVIVVLWFFSGIVTMYVGYPKLTRSEHLASLPELSAPTCCISLAEAWLRLPPGANPQLVTLTSIATRPVYKFELPSGFLVVDALTGTIHGEITPKRALDSAQAFLPAAQMRYLGITDEDMWTHSSRLHAHRPLHRLQADDARHTRLYVSSSTGEVVLDATRSERRWNYIGPWLHWLHPFRSAHEGWRVLIISLTLVGLALSLMGTILGVARWRFRGHYGNGRKTPYRNAFMRWHHVTGLLFALVTITWIFSGLMSINPWGIFRAAAMHFETNTIMGGALTPDRFQIDSRQTLANLPPHFRARELEWHLLDGRPYIVARNVQGQTRIQPGLADSAVIREFTETELRRAAPGLFPTATMLRAEMLFKHDSYYYPRETSKVRGDYDRSLPVLRAQFNDPSSTWMYLSPRTGTVTLSATSRERVERWLFFLLHSWDFHALLAMRPLWDLILIALSIGGLGVGITGTIIGVKRMRSKIGNRGP